MFCFVNNNKHHFFIYFRVDIDRRNTEVGVIMFNSNTRIPIPLQPLSFEALNGTEVVYFIIFP